MPNEEDLEIRAALARSPAVRVVYLTDIIVESGLQFSRVEIEAFAECFMLAPLSDASVKSTEDDNQIGFGFDLRTLQNDLAGVHVGVNTSGAGGNCFSRSSDQKTTSAASPRNRQTLD